MTVAEAQKEIRGHFVGGCYGQIVAAVLWAVSGALAGLASRGVAMAALVFGGFLIFPLTELRGVRRAGVWKQFQNRRMVHGRGPFRFFAPRPGDRGTGKEMSAPPGDERYATRKYERSS